MKYFTKPGPCICGIVNGPHGCNPMPCSEEEFQRYNATIVAIKGEEMPSGNEIRWETQREAIKRLEAQNARLKAELEALKPKPVIKKYSVKLDACPEGGIYDDLKVQFIFTDGKLTHAEVL